jgi:hypothetical protein
MELYTLAPDFTRDEVVDQHSSIIWTERYTSAGDVALVAEPSSANMSLFSEGTFLAVEGSKEVMILDTLVVENGLLTVTGSTLLKFLINRIIRNTTTHSVRSWIIEDQYPGQAIASIVNAMCILGSYPTPATEATNSVITNLSLGPVDVSGSLDDFSVPFGPLYDAIQTIAETYLVGMSLYLDSASESGYSLKFTTYQGRDLTSDQAVYPTVRFGSVLDTLSDPKELRSISGYKNICWAYAPGVPAWMSTSNTGFAYVPGTGLYTDFERRVMQIFVEDIDSAYLESIDPTQAQLLLNAILTARARDALANNNHTKVVDGEVVPQSEFEFGTHYLLGDIVELQAHSDIVQKARITEYIRSEDESGERAYPTVSVID